MDKEQLLNSEIEIQVIEIFSNSHKTSYGQKILTRGLDEVVKKCSKFVVSFEITDYRIKTYDIISDWKKILIKDLPGDLIAEIIQTIEMEESIIEENKKSEKGFKSFYENFSLKEHGKAFYIEDDYDNYCYSVLIKKDSEINIDSLNKEAILKMIDEDGGDYVFNINHFENSEFEEKTADGCIIEDLARKYYESLVENKEQKIIVISDYLH